MKLDDNYLKYFFPALKTGTVQFRGETPVLNDELNINANGLAGHLDIFFRSEKIRL